MTIDPKLDLVLERVVEVSPERVWTAWTQPEHLKKWFTPVPWSTVECEIDLRPGGLFRTVMRSPEGQDHPNRGCYLEVVPNRKLVWTNALEAGFRPSRPDEHLGFHFTATILLEPQGQGTRYTAIVMHADEEDRHKHDAMGFKEGWGTVLEQLVEYMKTARL
jgi:uncharacterized protein YndB with AHSA1/START domain